MKIFLVGFMGCGKSHFGKRLAIQSGWDFLDTDREIERRAGLSIPEIFERHGEQRFRELERQTIGELAAIKRDTVVALGGGAVCCEGTMEMLNGAGLTVYLKMSPERLVARIDKKGRDKRPKIKGMDDGQLLSFVEKLLPEREKYYNKATFVLDCEGVADERIVGLLLRQVEAIKC